MSILQEQAVRMIRELPDDSVGFLIEVIRRIMPQKPLEGAVQPLEAGEGMKAFYRLVAAREEIRRYLPEDFGRYIRR